LLSEVGLALNDIDIRIVNDAEEQVEEGTSGNIQLRGKNITRGYYNKPDATAAAFSGEWLRTGDIGFFFDGHLYISGRQKDVIFKNGRNFFANDLETMACTIDEIKYGKVCFGGITGRQTGQDVVIAFISCISDQNALEIFRRLRTLLSTNLGITVDEIVLIKSNEIPKTSSGKLQRYKLLQKYINQEFNDRRITANDLLNETRQ
jgi:acyl-CoA synthetase (AMP-forming)/AMP-acid ligase II